VVNWWVRLAPAARPASAFLSCACPPVHACVYCTHAVGVQVDFYSGGAGKLRDPEEEPRRRTGGGHPGHSGTRNRSVRFLGYSGNSGTKELEPIGS
jgi:hypothetical protein